MKMIRKATVKDIKKIYKLVNYFAKKGEMLPRSLNELYNNIRDFFVFEIDKKIVGCVALHISWQNLAEIKSLAVLKKNQNHGVGKQLVNTCIEDAKKLGIKKILVLTSKPKYFAKFGFRKVKKEKLPHKIWTECINCPIFPKCNEFPLIKIIK